MRWHDPILYACVASGSTVLAELRSGDPDLDAISLRCLRKAPAFHLRYSHSARKRIYAFLMEDHFVYFAVADEALGKARCLLFLERLRDAFTSWLLDHCAVELSFRCFQDEFAPVIRGLLPPLVVPEVIHDGKVESKATNNRGGETPEEEDNAAILDGKESSERKEAKRSEPSKIVGTGNKMPVWAHRVRTIILVDSMVCLLLFVIWLLVCKGFRCIAPGM